PRSVEGDERRIGSGVELEVEDATTECGGVEAAGSLGVEAESGHVERQEPTVAVQRRPRRLVRGKDVDSRTVRPDVDLARGADLDRQGVDRLSRQVHAE